MILKPGAHLGPYEILSPLGAGGMGEVYKARDTRLDRTVAIKVLPTGMAADPRRQARFRREARAISSLTHPHICTLHDIGEQNGVDFLVMEYLPGETLAHRLLRGALPLKDAIRIAMQLADALDAAHRQGLTHRDLKPANVMLTSGGAKVLDFGLAKWHSGDSSEVLAASRATVDPTLTQAGAVVGTIQYMAPEQLEGRPADARSDLFALGAIIYEMTTGRKAFEGASATSVMAAILQSTPAAMSTLQPISPPALDRVVGKALSKDPSTRWQSAADLRDALAWIDEDLGAPAAGAAGRTVKTGSPTRWRHWVSTLVVVASALSLVAAFLLNRPHSPDQTVPVRFVVLPPEKTTGADVPIVSPDGRRLAFVARTAGEKSSLWVRSFDELESRAVADADDLAFPFWSPDGQSIGFFAQGRLKRIAAAGGPAQVVCDAPSARGGAWNRDGVIVFAPTAEGPLYRVSAAGGAPFQLTTLDKATAERSHRFPQFLVDGHHVMYSVYFNQANQKQVIQVASLDSPGTTRVTNSSFDRAWAPPGYLLFKREQGGALLAQPFDHASLRLTAEPVAIVDRISPGAKGGDAAFSVSNNGVLAYERVTGDRLSELAWFDRAGQRLSAVGPAEDYGAVSISPDGSRVATEREDPQRPGSDVWVIERARGVTSRIIEAHDPVWSPEGDRLAFSSGRRGTGNPDLYVAKWNGGGREEPLLVSDPGKYAAHWSQDGRFLLFQQQEGARSVDNLWMLPMLGSGKPKPFVQTDFDKENAQFSPDSRWVAYDSDESSRPEVYVQSFPDAATRSQVSTDGGTQPRWRRDGTELFYISLNGKMMTVTAKTEPIFKSGVPAALFGMPGVVPFDPRYESSGEAMAAYDVSADGQRFLIRNRIREPSRSPMTVVLNWTAGLKK